MPIETVHLEGLRGTLDMLKRLPPELVSKNGGPVKLALKKAAEVLRDEARANVQRIIDEPNLDEQATKSTGLLKKSIVAARGKMPPGLKGERYSVRVRKNQRYPASRGKDLTAVQIGRQLETGTERREEPKPWLRPAFDAKKQAAVDTFVTEVNRRGQALIDKLDREAKAKG